MVLAGSGRVKAGARSGLSCRAYDGATARNTSGGAYPSAVGNDYRLRSAPTVYVTKYEGGVSERGQAIGEIAYMIMMRRVAQSQPIGGPEHLEHRLRGIDVTVVVAVDVEQIACFPVAAAIRASPTIRARAQYCILTTLNGFTTCQMQGSDQGVDGTHHPLARDELLKGRDCYRSDGTDYC